MFIKVNKNSIISSEISSNPLLNGTNCSFMEIDDNSPLYEGENSKICKVVSINGIPFQDLLCKEYKNGFPPTLEGIVRQVNKNNEKFKKCESLKAFPLFLFNGINNGKAFFGSIMREVKGETFDKLKKKNDYNLLPFESKLKLCLQLATAMNILNEISILHADFGFDNMIIDINDKNSPNLFLIDFDAGSATIFLEMPISKMKDVNEIIPPEIWKQKLNDDNVKIDRNSENWTIAATMHCLLFSCGPFFFIKTFPDIPKYLKENTWPEIDYNSPYFRNDNLDDYRKYKDQFYKLSNKFREGFRTIFQKGYENYNFRMSPYQLKVLIENELRLSSQVIVRKTTTFPKKQSSPIYSSIPIKTKSIIEKPILLSPLNGYISLSKNISFHWNSIPGVTRYEFVLYDKFGQVIHQKIISNSYIIITLNNEGEYIWKVRAGDNNGNWGPWSDTWKISLKIITNFGQVRSQAPSHPKYTLVKNILLFVLIALIIGTIINLPRINDFLSTLPQNSKSQTKSTVQIIEKVKLLSPMDNKIIEQENINLIWFSANGASKYEVVLYNNSGKRLNKETIVNTTYLNVDLSVFPDGEKIYWKVRAVDYNGNWGPWSDTWSFIIKHTQNFLPAPNLYEPSNGLSEVSTTPTFSWSSVSGANYYWLIVATNLDYLPTDPQATNAPNCVISEVIQGTSYTPSTPLKPGTTYYWEVQSLYKDNTNKTKILGYYSNIWNFTTKQTQIENGFFSVDSNPSGAIVFIDGNLIGATPLNYYKLEPGEHSIIISKSGYKNYKTNFQINENELTDLGVINLISVEVQNGFISVDTNPSGANVFIDGDLKGVTPLNNYPLKPGIHTIVISKFGYMDYTRSVNIEANKTFTISVTLIKVEESFSMHTYGIPLAEEKIELQVGFDVIIVDYKTYYINTGPEIKDGLTYIPLVAVSEAFGAELEWDGINAINIRWMGNNLQAILQIGNSVAIVNNEFVNGQISLEGSPYIKNNEIMVPIRFISIAFRKTIGWNPTTGIITIYMRYMR